LSAIAAARAGGKFRSSEHTLTWLAIDVLVRFEAVLPDIRGIEAGTRTSGAGGR
jgi:hypothetical protein